MRSDRGEEREHEGHSEYIGSVPQYDPIQRTLLESPRFTSAAFKNGESLTTLQRFGYGIIALAYLIFGFFFCYVAVLNHRGDSHLFALLFGSAAAFLLFIGTKGMRNVFRFPRR
jgi:hypothetical protein